MSPLKSPPSVGDHIDHYRLDGVFARSNLATLFRARDLRHDRDVLIKVPHPEVKSDPTFADWFRREQETCESLDHSGVLKVISDPDRTEAYIVMEWFEGRPLREILDQEKRLAPERAIRIAINICNALEYVHGRGFIHGDLRPENVLVGAGDAIKLMEFSGAAKTKARRLTLTKIAQITGSSDYISPEEVLGKRVDARSDVYSLGIVLYEMLTGKHPFPHMEPTERLLNHPIPPREIDPAISLQLQEVIYRAMERNPQNRYASARELARDLEHLDQVGVVDRPELKAWKKRRPSPVRKVLLYLAIALIPLLIFGLLLYIAKH